MKITNLQLTSATALNFEIAPTAPICIICGHYSDLALDLIRELIGDYGVQNDSNRFDSGRFVIHADVVMDDKNYNTCYIHNADFTGNNHIAVNFKSNSIYFSEDDTREFVDKCNYLNKNDFNVLVNTADVIHCSDDRPIFIYDYFERLDESIDITPILDKLVSLGRQVFVAVCSNYPVEKIKHDKVHIVKTGDQDV